MCQQVTFRQAVNGLLCTLIGLAAQPMYAQSETRPTLSVDQIRALTREHSSSALDLYRELLKSRS